MTDPNPSPTSPVPESTSTQLQVTEEEAGSRLDLFLAKRLKASRRDVRRWLERGRVSGEGRVLGLGDKGTPLAAGADLVVENLPPLGIARIFPEPDASLHVLADGEGWLAVNKPAGVPVHPLHDGELGTVLNAIVAREPKVLGVGEGALRSGVVHRLDVETSGVLLVGTQVPAWERLREAFRAHRVQKIYRALVSGQPDWPEVHSIEVGLRVAQHRPARVRVMDLDPASDRARPVWMAQQEMRVLETLGDCSLVEVRPRTGFLHQIRVTLAHLGHPVLGDGTYGSDENASRAGRHMLHAARVQVDEIDVEAPDPEDFSSLVERLRADAMEG